MKICIVAEGCYPYVVGGVSSWVHSMIKSFPDQDFILLTIVANRSYRGKFVYELPENLLEVHEVYLEDSDWNREGTVDRRKRLDKEEYEALKSLLLNQNVKWRELFKLFARRKLSLNELLMGPDFLRAVKECYQIRYPEVVFSDFLWTMRSIYLPLFLVMETDVPKAHLYHCVATGYAGILGCMARYKHRSRLIISEHGIYTREREEELIRAKWVEGIYKNIWIEQFKKMSRLAYSEAELVTSLYEHARELQVELGCPREITMVTPNGIDASRFVVTEDMKRTLDEGMIHVGAVLRVTPIKDVKTLIRAFSFAKEKVPALKLWIMGPADEDPKYAQECVDLVQALEVKDIVFTGRINVTEYLWQMDMTILTSISEGQPLTILEGYAAHKPAIATDVGNCRGLIYGEGDSFGAAGILTHVMNVEEITAAILELAYSKEKRVEMGENGYKRLMAKYKIEDMRKTYQRIYRDIEDWLY
ncbi:MAG: GT4 family glycosyltransferase PelF [Blautia sp.]|nr:GT4 family glycosyltransferase PelF [Blautia sp.]